MCVRDIKHSYMRICSQTVCVCCECKLRNYMFVRVLLMCTYTHILCACAVGVCDMKYSYVWPDASNRSNRLSPLRRTRLIHTCDMTHPNMRNGSLICAPCEKLQCVAVCCSVLQCVAVCRSALLFVACCSVLQRVAATQLPRTCTMPHSHV